MQQVIERLNHRLPTARVADSSKGSSTLGVAFEVWVSVGHWILAGTRIGNPPPAARARTGAPTPALCVAYATIARKVGTGTHNIAPGRPTPTASPTPTRTRPAEPVKSASLPGQTDITHHAPLAVFVLRSSPATAPEPRPTLTAHKFSSRTRAQKKAGDPQRSRPP